MSHVKSAYILFSNGIQAQFQLVQVCHILTLHGKKVDNLKQLDNAARNAARDRLGRLRELWGFQVAALKIGHSCAHLVVDCLILQNLNADSLKSQKFQY